MRSENKFITKNKFKSKASWEETAGAYFLWPSLMVEKDIDVGIDVKITRRTLAWGRKRWRWDTGTYTPLPTGEIVWSKIGLDDFSKWAKKSYNRKWGRAEIESIVVDKPELKDIIVKMGLTKHYTRILMGREIIEKESESVYGNAMMDENSIKDNTGRTQSLISALNKHTQQERKAIDPLDQLGSKILNSGERTMIDDE